MWIICLLFNRYGSDLSVDIVIYSFCLLFWLEGIVFKYVRFYVFGEKYVWLI